MAELAVGHISIVADTSKLPGQIKKSLGGVSGYGSDVGSSIGSKISSGIGKALKAGVAGVGVAAGGALAGSITKGLGRLTGIETAQAKLKGLGNDAESVEAIMDNALASVKGTSFGLGEAATTAAGAVAAGIKPGKELEDVLKSVANSAAATGSGMDEMGGIFNKVASIGKAQNDVLMQVADRGLPIYEALADQLGVTTDEVFKMASAGEIGFAEFESAMTQAAGTVADELGGTTIGTLQNVGSAMGRFGESLLAPAFSAAPSLFGGIITVFDEMTDAVKPVSEELGNTLTPALEGFADIIETRVAPMAGEAVGKIGDIVLALTEKALDPGTWEKFGDVFTTIKDVVTEMWPSIESLAGSFLTITQNVSVATWQALANVLNAIAPLIESVLVPLVEKVAEFAENNPGVIEKIVMAFLGFKGLKAIAGPVGTAASTIGTLGGAVKGVSAAFKGATLGQGLLTLMGGAKSANPILAKLGGAIGTVFKAFWKIGPVLMNVGKIFGSVIRFINPWVGALTLVTGALTWFFTKTELGQQIWENLTTAIAAGWSWLVETVFQPMGSFFTDTLWPAIQSVLGFIGDAFSALWDGLSGAWENVIQPVFNGIWQLAQATLAVIGTIILAPLLIAWNLLSSAIQWAWENVIQPVWTALSNFAVNTLWPMLQGVFQWIGDKWQWLSNNFSLLWGWIRDNVLTPMVGFFQVTLWPAIQKVLTWIGDKWNWLSNTLSIVWGWIRDNIIQPMIDGFHRIWNVVLSVAGWISDKWNWMGNQLHRGWRWIDENVIAGFRRGMDKFKSFFDGVVNGIKNVWNGLRSALAKPINFMINTVYNDGILRAWNTIAGFLPGLDKASPLAGIPEHATGGRISGPGTGTSDDVLMWGSNGEHMLTAREVQRFGGHGHVYAMRKMVEFGRPFSFDGHGGLTPLPRSADNRAGDLYGAAPGLLPAYKDGGEIRPMWENQLMAAHKFAQSQHGKPYQWAGPTGPGSSFDCSGFMGSIAATIQGTNPWQRYWATGSFPSPGAQGFAPGLGPGFSIGIFNGGPYGGHTAGTLGPAGPYGSVNVESGGAPSMVKYGPGAVGADHSQFTMRYHLPIGADGSFVSGGNGGISPEAMQDGLKKKISGLIDKAMDPILSKLPVGPPEWKNIPKNVYDKGKKGMLDTAFDVVGKLGDKLASVWTAAGEVKDLVTGAVSDAASWVNDRVRSIVVRDNGGLVPSGAAAVNFSGKDELMLPPSTTALFNKFLKDMPGVAGALERSAVAFQAAAEELGLQEQARKSAEDYAAEQASGLLGTFGLEGIVPVAQKLGADAWEAYQASPYDVGVNGQTIVVEYVGDENDREWKMLQKLDKEVALLKAKRKPKASAMTRGGVQ